MRATLYDRIYGCNAAVTISNSMGDVTEGMSYQAIEERFGFVDSLLAQEKRRSVRARDWGPNKVRAAHYRPPGMTEDGIERHRLMCTAIIERGGRVDAWDLGRVWSRDINPKYFGYVLGTHDRIFYDLFQAGMPPPETGRYADWPTFIGTSKMMLPVGIINAGNPEQAAHDALNLGRIKDTPHRAFNYALEVAAGLAAACAEALRPNATVEGVIAEGLSHLSDTPAAAVHEALEWTEQADDVWALRPRFAEKYQGRPTANAVEVFAAGLAVLRMVKGDLYEAIVTSVNFGRDCDCISYVAAGLSAALHGSSGLKEEWIRTVDDELQHDPYTVSRRSLRGTADGLYEALRNEMSESKARTEEFSAAIAEHTRT